MYFVEAYIMEIYTGVKVFSFKTKFCFEKKKKCNILKHIKYSYFLALMLFSCFEISNSQPCIKQNSGFTLFVYMLPGMKNLEY